MMPTSEGCSGTQLGRSNAVQYRPRLWGGLAGFSPQLCILQAVWSWLSHFSSPNLSFLICQMGTTADSSLQGFLRTQGGR